jgi:hypothetical protein
VNSGSRCAQALFRLHAVADVGYSPRLAFRRRSSVVERILGKAEVGSSILPGGTIGPKPSQGFGADLIRPLPLHLGGYRAVTFTMTGWSLTATRTSVAAPPLAIGDSDRRGSKTS